MRVIAISVLVLLPVGAAAGWFIGATVKDALGFFMDNPVTPDGAPVTEHGYYNLEDKPFRSGLSWTSEGRLCWVSGGTDLTCWNECVREWGENDD